MDKILIYIMCLAFKTPKPSPDPSIISIQDFLHHEVISQCDVKHIFMSLIKTIMPVLRILTYIITNITTTPVGLVIMSDSTFKTAVILYV